MSSKDLDNLQKWQGTQTVWNEDYVAFSSGGHILLKYGTILFCVKHIQLVSQLIQRVLCPVSLDSWPPVETVGLAYSNFT